MRKLFSLAMFLIFVVSFAISQGGNSVKPEVEAAKFF